jgi:hypothetical protein
VSAVQFRPQPPLLRVSKGLKKTRALARSGRAVADPAFDLIRDKQLIETRAEHFLQVLGSGKVSTNNYLQRFHNFAVDIALAGVIKSGTPEAVHSNVGRRLFLT